MAKLPAVRLKPILRHLPEKFRQTGASDIAVYAGTMPKFCDGVA
jgi:hypothetical protein